MYCTNCGTWNGDEASRCSQCGNPMPMAAPAPMAPGVAGQPLVIPNHLVEAILVTLCCCLPFGIVSIIYATQVNTKRDMGDIAGALEASNNAKKWAMIGAGVGVVWLIIVIAFNGLALIAGMAGANGG